MRIALFVLFAFFYALPAVADHDSQANKPYKLKVAFNNPGFNDRGFWKDVTDTMQAAADQFGMELHVWYGERDAKKIKENAAKIFESGIKFDYIIIVNEYQQLSGFLRKAEQQKIPTLFLLNSITEEQAQVIGRPGEIFKYWLGSLVPDNRKAGYQMARSLIQFANSKNWQPPFSLLTLSGDNRTPASLHRNSGLSLALSETTAVNELGKFHTNWSKEKAYEETRNFLERQGTAPQLIWAANDNLGLGAIKAMEEHNLKAGRDFAVAGLNWSAAGLKAVLDKHFTMTHGGHFFAGAWAMVALYDHHNGSLPDKEIDFPMQAITLKNIDDFEVKLGARDWNKIDFRSFSKTHNDSLSHYNFTLDALLNAAQ